LALRAESPASDNAVDDNPDQATHVYKRKAHDELVCHHALGEVSDEFIGASEVIFNDHDICCYIPGLFLLAL
jgi:hypothetical protein